MDRRERGLWIAAGCWLFIIYATLYPARYATEFLRERNLLRLTVATVFLAVAAVLFYLALKRRPGPRELSVLFAAAAIAMIAAGQLDQVEERLHVVEYGVFAVLVYSALVARGSPHSAWWALGITAAFGWIDEGIQYLLPNRYYGLADVAINAASGAFAILAMVVADRARAADTVARGDLTPGS